MQQPRALARHRRILEAALRVFSRRGYRDASVDDIARDAGTSKGGVYFHFPNKEAMFLALLDRTAARLREKIDSTAAQHEDPVAKADAALRVVLHTFSKHRALARLFMVEALGAGHEFHGRMVEIRREFAGLIRRHLDTASAQGLITGIDTDIASRAWFGALNEILTDWVLSGRQEGLDSTYAALRPLLMRGVGLAADGTPTASPAATAGATRRTGDRR